MAATPDTKSSNVVKSRSRDRDDPTPTENSDTKGNTLDVGVPNERLLDQSGASDQIGSKTGIKDTEDFLQCEKNYKRSWLWDWWLWEIAGIVLSLAVTVAIIVILGIYNGRPLADWPYSITLNAVVSVFSTVAKSSMLLAVTQAVSQTKWLLFHDKAQKLIDFHTIDEASRGPFGALYLLLYMKGRVALASIGAFIILASLVVEPFSQQVLSYPLKSINVTGGSVATVPRIQSWTPSDDASQGMLIEAVVYNTLFSQGANNSTLTFDCPTSNCTFAPFMTLAFCSKCSDITARVTPSCQGTCTYAGDTDIHSVQGTKNCSSPGTPATDPWNGIDGIHVYNMSCNYTTIPQTNRPATNSPTEYGYGLLPLSLTNSYIHSSFGVNNTSDRQKGVRMSTAALSTVSNPYLNTSFVNSGSPILVLSRALLHESSASYLSPSGVGIEADVASCALHMCVQTLVTRIRNGILHQEVLSSWINETSIGKRDYGNRYLNVPPNMTDPAVPGNLSFYASSAASSDLLQFLEQIFSSTQPFNAFPSPDKAPRFPNSTTYPEPGHALGMVDDLNKIMNPLADRLTDWLRSQSTDEPALGTASTLRVHISVSWWWLVLPIGLVLLSSLILIATIVTSKTHHTKAWKSNSLASLFHGLPVSQQENTPLMFPQQMAKAAEQMCVRLENDENHNPQLVILEHLELETSSFKESKSRSAHFVRFPQWSSRKRVKQYE